MQQRSPKKNAAAKDCRGVRNRKGIYEKLLDDVNRFLDVVVRLVDVFESALLETLGEGIATLTLTDAGVSRKKPRLSESLA